MARIPWSRIQDAFEGEWVELTDYAWRHDRLLPDAAHVRHHSADRRELLAKIASSGRLKDAVILFVGQVMPSTLATSAALAPRITGM
jgi:hypothetical protein